MGSRAAALALLSAACLGSPPGASPERDAGATADAGDAGEGCSGDIAATGDLLHYSFDEPFVTPIVHDHSGRRIDAAFAGGAAVTGVRGGAVELDADTDIFVPAAEPLYAGDRLTIEAWVGPTTGGAAMAIFSDLDDEDSLDEANAVELHLGLDAGRHLIFTTSDEEGSQRSVVAESATVPEDAMTHVAVTWDGETVRFYQGAALVHSAPLAGKPADVLRSSRVGRVQSEEGDRQIFHGVIDELKLSGCAKSEAQLALSMESQAPRCGDGLIEGAEACEEGECCSGCEPLSSGSCAAGGSCELGVCQVAAARPTGAIAVYDFEEGSGTTAADGAVAPLDLTVSSPSWVAGALVLGGGTVARSAQPADKILAACLATSEVSFEVWAAAAVETQEGVIAALDPGNGLPPGFALVQMEDYYLATVDARRANRLGGPGLDAGPAVAGTGLDHVVVTRAADGTRTIWVDGILRGRNQVGGSLLSWVAGAPLIAGAGTDGDRPWSGKLHRLAIYCRALSAAEVAAAYAYGPDP